MGKLPSALIAILIFSGLAFSQTQIGGGTCSLSSLTGNYWVTTNSRTVSASKVLSDVDQTVGMVLFDGKGHMAFNVTDNSAGGTGQNFQTSGAVNISSDCTGTVFLADNQGSFNLVVFNQGNAFNMTGTDGTATIAINGGRLPSSCVTSMLSGSFSIGATGLQITSHSISGTADLSGFFQFDGAGNVTAKWNFYFGAKSVSIDATGTYTMNKPSDCLGTITMTGSGGNVVQLWFAVANQTGGDFQLIGAGPNAIFQGAAHPNFSNPGQSVTNGASFKPALAPPGAIFAIFGKGLGPDPAQYGSTLPLPSTLGPTQVTVNGEATPMFYAGPGQINAQMPVDIKPGLATVVVTNGKSTSNAVAVNVPVVGPGIFTYGDNHAVVINAPGSTNSQAAPAHVGDTVVVYFTGGGPVNASGDWTSGNPAPLGSSPLKESNTVTVNGKTAHVDYMGLTGGSVGLYQANFAVPQVAAGDLPLVITVNGVKSNSAVISIAE